MADLTSYYWAYAAIWALISSSTLIFGAFLGIRDQFNHKGVARFMALGSGALLGLLTFDMTLIAKRETGLMRAIMGLLIGAVFFCSANWLLAHKGARHRKRCGTCVEQPSEAEVPGSGTAIAVGTIMDSIPEGLAIGIAVAHQGYPGIPAIMGFLLANFPESLSSTTGMHKAGRSKLYIYLLWISAVLLTVVGAVVGSLTFTHIPREAQGMLEATAAGLLLAMVVETAIPEAFDHSPDFSGVLFVIGFSILAFVTAA